MAGNIIGFVDSSSGSYNLASLNFIELLESTLTAVGQGWTTLRYDTSNPEEHELILVGEGLSAAEEIYIGIKSTQNSPTDVYNLEVMVSTGYVPVNTFETQPNIQRYGVCAHNNRIDYWVSWNAQKVSGCLKVGTPVYESFYIGKFFPYAKPTQYPYPVYCGGTFPAAAPLTRFSDTNHSTCYFDKSTSYGGLRDAGGAWIKDTYLQAWPYTASYWSNTGTVEPTNGTYYPVFPVTLYDLSTTIYGTLDGILAISGFNNSVENTLVIGGDTYVVFEDIYRTGFEDFYVMKMEV